MSTEPGTVHRGQQPTLWAWRLAGEFTPAEITLHTPSGNFRGDPLYAVVSRRR